MEGQFNSIQSHAPLAHACPNTEYMYIKIPFALFLDLIYLQRYDLHGVMIITLGRFNLSPAGRSVLGSGGAVLSHAHLLHRRRVHDRHLHGAVVRQTAHPLPVLLAVGAPVQAAMGHARVARRVLVETEKVDSRLSLVQMKAAHFSDPHKS